MIEALIETQKEQIRSFLSSNYNIDLAKINNCGAYLDESIRGVLSLKVWSDSFKYQSKDYFDEIVSNFNQSIILSLMGFKVSSLILLRRSLENILAFIYYKDHPIEYLKKEFDANKRTFEKMEQLIIYIKEFPFNSFYQKGNDEILKKVTDNIKEKWDENYKALSNYVHSSNSKYLDLKLFLEDIKPQKEDFDYLNEKTKEIISLINILNILFFFSEYSNFFDHQKSLIRNSITLPDFKRKLGEYFQDI